MANEIRLVVTGQNKAKGPVGDAKKDVRDLIDEIKKVPDKKTIKLEVTDVDATRLLDKIKTDTIPDKIATIKADDQASGEIDKVSKQKPSTVKVPVKADTSGMTTSFDDAGKTGADAFIGGFTGGLIGGGIVDSAANLIGDAFAKAGQNKQIAADLQNAMGLSPDQAKELGGRVGKLYAEGVGESKDQIASAFGSLSSDVRDWGRLTTGEQDKIVKGAVAISKAFKVDVQEPIQAASSMVANKLSPSYEAAFDLITGGYQTLGSRADDALDSLQEYAGYFTQLGFDGPRALTMINDMMKAGARDTDYAADVWKEFGIVMLKGADTTKQALKDLGLNADAALKAIANGGPGAQDAIDKVLDKLRSMKDPIKRDEIGVALFGTQWEDTMKLVIGNIDIAKGHVADFKGATEAMATGSITEVDKLSRAWDEFAGSTAENTAWIINNHENFQEAQNTSIAGLLGFTDAEADATAQAYGLGTSLDGTNRGFQALADTVGGYASPKFIDMVMRMNDTQLAAYGVTRTLDETGRMVLNMPEGKPIIIDTNARTVISDLSTVKSKVDALPSGSRFFTYFVDTVIRGPGPGTANLPMPFRGYAAGGAVAHAAEGGARSGLVRVNEQGPELGRTQAGVLRDLQSGMTVVPAGQSARMAAAANGGQAGGNSGPIVINLMLDRRTLETVIVDTTRGYVQAKGGGSVSKAFGVRP